MADVAVQRWREQISHGGALTVYMRDQDMTMGRVEVTSTDFLIIAIRYAVVSSHVAAEPGQAEEGGQEA